jgi:hypothetical protein
VTRRREGLAPGARRDPGEPGAARGGRGGPGGDGGERGADRSVAAVACFALAAVAFTLVFFREEIFGGRIAVYRDRYTILLALDWTVRQLSRGDWLPTWNPFEVLGKPLAADPLAAVVYPPAWIMRALPFPLGDSVSTAFHHVIAASGGFALLRRRGTSAAASALGGVLFGFGGALVSADNMRNVLQSAAWMPWALLGFDHFCERGGAAALAGTALAVGLTLLGGLPEVFAFEQALFAAVAIERRGCGGPGLAAAAAGALAADLLGCGLAAALLVPAAELVLRSSRMGGLDPAAASELSLSPRGLLAFVVPRHYVDSDGAFHETAALLDAGRTRAPWALTLYLGPVLAVIAAIRRGRFAWTWAAAALVFLLVALGEHVPGQSWLLSRLPLLRVVRHPEKALLAVQLSLAVLAGSALEAAVREPARFGRVAAAAGGLAMVAAAGSIALQGTARFELVLLRSDLALAAALLVAVAAITAAGRVRPHAAALALVALASADLLRANSGLLPVVEAGELRAPPETLAATATGEPPVRIYSDALGVRPRRPFPDAFLLERELLLWEVSSYFGIANLNAPSSLNLVADEHLMRLVEGAPRARVAPILGALSTGWVTSTKDLSGFDGLERVALPGGAGPVSAWRVRGAVPRAFVPRSVVAMDGREAAAAHLAGFDRPSEVVAVEEVPPGLPAEIRGSVAIENYGGEDVELAADFATPGLVVLNDAWDPSWRATVDGDEARVLRVNGFVRGVAVPAGRHRVRFEYRPASVRLGGSISLLSVLVAAALLARGRARDALRP